MATRKTQPDILVVEDDYAIREGIAELLEAQGYVAERATDGASALEALRGGLTPSLIVLDLAMPVMNGWQLCRELSRDPELARIPVILMSAGAERIPPVPPNLVGFFCKPLDLPRMLEAIRGCGGGVGPPPPPGTSIAIEDFRRASCS